MSKSTAAPAHPTHSTHQPQRIPSSIPSIGTLAIPVTSKSQTPFQPPFSARLPLEPNLSQEPSLPQPSKHLQLLPSQLTQPLITLPKSQILTTSPPSSPPTPPLSPAPYLQTTTKTSDARKVFDKLTERNVSSPKEVPACVALGKRIYIYMEEKTVENEINATSSVGFEKRSNEKIMGFDPGGGTFDALFDEIGVSLFELFSASGFQERYHNSMRVSFSCGGFVKIVESIILYASSDDASSRVLDFVVLLVGIRFKAINVDENGVMKKVKKDFDIYLDLNEFTGEVIGVRLSIFLALVYARGLFGIAH